MRLNASAQSDIYWWKEFAAAWNGTSMLAEVRRNSPDAVITSDASGQWGCGAYILWPTVVPTPIVTFHYAVPHYN